MIVASGTDKVLFGMSLPKNTTLNGINAQIRAGVQEDVIQGAATQFGIEGWIIPVVDPDAGASFQLLFDQFVPKDTDAQTMDLDTVAADATPFYEPGEVDLTMFLDVGLKPEKVFGRYDMVTVADPGAWKYADTETPFSKEWRPSILVNVRVKKKYRIRQPSVLLFGFASPDTEDTTSTIENALLENEWGRVQYMGETLRRAHLGLLGVVETGAETPWEDAVTLLQKHLEPDVFEENAGTWKEVDWIVWSRAKIDHSVPGFLRPGIISTGRG